MITWSGFVAYMLDNQTTIPAKDWMRIREHGKDRLRARQAQGRADSVLDFPDLVLSAESIVAPR